MGHLKFPMSEARNRHGFWPGLLAASLLLAGFSGLSLTSAWAQGGQVQSVEYQAGVLTLAGAQPLPEPKMDVWPSSDGTRATEIVILTFPGVSANSDALQPVIGKILIEHPELKKLLITPNAEGLQVVLEAPLPDGVQTPQPTTRQLSGNQWQLLTQGNAETVPGSLPTAVQTQKQVMPTPVDVNGANETARPDFKKFALKFWSHPEKERALQQVSELEMQQKLMGAADQLQQTINERDELERKVQELQQALNQKIAASSNTPVDLHGALIRDYESSIADPVVRDSVTIQNLRRTVLQLAVKLKATENALNQQAGKSRSLAEALATLKHDPSILNDPLLVATVDTDAVDPSTVDVSQAVKQKQVPKAKTEPKTSAKASNENAIKQKFIYKPPVDTRRQEMAAAVAASNAAFKEQEVSLKAAIKEHPRNTAAYLKLADLYVGHDHYDQAGSILSQLIQANPGYSDGYYYLALVYLGQKRALEAQAALETYKRLNPSDQENIQPAEQAIKAALQNGPGQPKVSSSSAKGIKR